MSDKKSSLLDKIPFMQKLKNIKHIEFIILAIFIIVLAVIYLSSTNKKEINNLAISGSSSLEEYGDLLETKLENVIKNINGAGNVSVMVTFDGRITYEYAKEKEEVTTSSSVTGGTNTKTTTNEKLIIVSQNGKETPLVVKEIYPPVSGVVVVSSGAKDVAVKLNIISAVETLIDVDVNKIKVIQGN